METVEQNVLAILRHYRIPDFININHKEVEFERSFTEKLQHHVTERYNAGLPVELDCLISILCEFCEAGNASDVLQEGLIKCIPHCVGSGKDLCRLFDLLRSGIARVGAAHKAKNQLFIPIQKQHNVLAAVERFVHNADPPHISMPGDKDSYLQVSAIPLPQSRAYTVSMWVKLSKNAQTKGFLLYRYRSSSSGVDAIISACTQETLPGTWNLTIRSSCEKKGQRDEVQCRLKIPPGEWHLVTVKQAAMKDGADAVSVAVDGVSALEAELLYPYNFPVSESIWIFGLGLKGQLASIALYPMDLPSSIIELLHTFGPNVANLTIGARCPQSSFDTGHLILGTVCAKGNLAAKLCQYVPIFCITAAKLAADARIPLVTPGVVYSDHIDLQPRAPEHDELLVATLTGSCVARGVGSGVDIWQDAGGCALVMYLFWSYCDVKFPPGSLGGAKTPTNLLEDFAEVPEKTLLEQVKDGISGSLSLLALLISSSTDFKEQFIQCHGFHVLGYCLSMLPEDAKKLIIDEEMVDRCFAVIRAMGPDAAHGDGISAAMQGLLFDFRIWGSCELPALRHFLQLLSSQLLDVGRLMYKCVGVQRILDIFRLHIARKLTGTSNASSSASAGKTAGAEDLDELALECADSVHRLLIIAMDAAQSFAAQRKGSLVPDAEALLRCLEETSSVIIAERILRIVGNLRLSAPQSLKVALHGVRFSDTAIIPLLSKKGFSLEVRSGALCNMLWMWSEDARTLPAQIIPLRKALNQLIIAQNPGPIGTSHRRSVVMADTLRTKTLIEQITEMVRPLEKCWVNLSMIAEVLRSAMAEGNWGKLAPSVLSASTEASNGALSGADLLEYVAPITAVPAPVSGTDVSALIRVIMHSGQFDSWMQLPLLPALLAWSDLDTCCSILMSMNVLFKTDDNQCEALSNIPSSAWLKALVSLAIMGEKAAIRCEGVVSADGTHAGATDSDSTVAATCTELALDCVSIILEYKTRTQLPEKNPVWQIFQNVVHTACVSSFGENKLSEEVELGILRRVVSLLLHRIANNGEVWVSNLVVRVMHIFAMVEARKLFGASDSNAVPASGKPDSAVDLLNLDFEDESPDAAAAPHSMTEQLRRKNKAIQETNIICFVFDICNSLRRAADRGALHGLEWKVLKIALRITLSALDTASERVADRIMQEILAQLKYMSERWAPISGNGYKSQLMVILITLKGTIDNPSAPEYLRGRYSALVFGIMHSFIEFRHFVASGGTLSEQVLTVLDALMGIDSCNDIALIFKLLDVTMRKADAISFEEVEVQDDGDSPRSDNIGASESYISLNKEKFTADDDKLVKITSDEESGAEYNDLPSTADANGAAETQPAPATGLETDGGALIATDAGSSTGSVNPDLLAGTKAPSAAPASSLPSEVSQRSPQFVQWLKVRQGISSERVDSERARLSRSMDTLDLTSEATKKFWKKARRKVESECFLQAHPCQWKLGVAHEGPFFGRRRVVLRPRFHTHYGHVVDHTSLETEFASMQTPSGGLGSPTDKLNRALAKACAGYIKDVTSSEGVDASTDDKELGNGKGGKQDGSAPPVPGTGWGLVDVDGSEEGGFGVVGIAAADSTPTGAAEDLSAAGLASPESPDALGQQVDDMGDVRQLEENFRQGKGTETGPCHSGTRRVGSGPALLDTPVILITASGNFWGSLSFNGKEIFFASTFETEDGRKDDSAAVNLVKDRRMRRRRWVLSSVSGIYMRRFRLRDSAMEVFFKKGKHRNFFVDFGHTKENARQRNEFARALMTAAPATAFKQVPTMSASRLVYEHKVQEKWLDGKMSNFDYLMALNTLAGRSYNDLCQYPVFPWVLSDYTSSSLDLADEKVYRDLSKPMGALNENRLREFLDRFNTFEENISSGIPAFMYGSHYSTMVGVVLHFLVRLQPFAALHKEMQNGHFDVPDRLFSSIPRSFRHNTTQLSEVKELIPEWFTTPDMFRNVNRFPLGQTQDGDLVDDVELPPWASSPEEFVRINRAALESDFVSAHLHEWIDLIFGYKQRGPDAVEANNVFYYLTYYGAVNHYMITDEALRRATELQIAHFGQTPMQLFKVPHPAKKTPANLSAAGVPRPLRQCFGTPAPAAVADSKPDAGTQLALRNDCDEELLALQAPCTVIPKMSSTRVLKAEVLLDRLLCVLDNGVIEVIKYGTSEAAKAAMAYSASLPKPRSKSGKKVDSNGKPAAQDAAGGTGDLIVLDELFDPFAELQREHELQEAAKQGNADSKAPGDEVAAEPRMLLLKHEYLIAVERESAHFDIIPRVPVMKPYQAHWRAAFRRLRDAADLTRAGCTSERLAIPATEQIVSSMIFTRSCHLLVTAGHVDGRVAVREVDTRTGFVKAAADFTAHRRRVVALSSDAIPSGTTDVMATCDEAGIIMVWTILRTKTNEQTGGVGYVVSRRPQRLFRCDAQPDMLLEISWQLGVVTVVSGCKVCVFSIERDELIKSFYVDADACADTTKAAEEQDPATVPAPYTSSTGRSEGPSGAHHAASNCVCRRMILSDFAVVVVHLETFTSSQSAAGGSAEVVSEHSLVATTLSGHRTGVKQCHSPVTFMSCPDRNEYLLLGFADGTVQVCCALSLTLMYSFQPHRHAVPCALQGAVKDPGAAQDASARDALNRRRSVASTSEPTNASANMPAQQETPSQEASAVISVSVGPNKAMPAVLCVMTESGRIYLRALPDFVRWERVRMPSTLQQLASVPLQAVKGTLMQAQNWTTETAGVLVQNARSLADDALGELRKMNKGKIASGVASFFGLGKRTGEK